MGHLVGQRWDQSGCVCILSKGKKFIVCFSPFCHMKPKLLLLLFLFESDKFETV